MLIHILGPLVIYFGFVVVTYAVRWHGMWTDSLAILFIVCVNTWSIWTAEWNARLLPRWRIAIAAAAVLVSGPLMIYLALTLRTDLMGNFG